MEDSSHIKKANNGHDAPALSDEKDKKKVKVQTRETWSRKIEFLLAGIGYSVGLGNVWRFPFLCYRSGGGAFLIPFFIMLVLLGIPLLYMEIAIGQYFKAGPVKAFGKICPLLKGVGIASVAISFIMCTYYNLIISFALYYFINSFWNPLPWHSCNNTWNHPETCTDSHTVSNTTESASQQFFDYQVLQKTSGLDNLGNIRWEIFGLLALAWVIVYFCIFKGVTWTGKIVYFTALFPYVVLLALLINNTQLPGAPGGINYFVNPEWEKLKEVQVWVYAAVQVFNSLGIGFGSLISMASYNKFNNKILNDTLAISLTNTATSILSGFVIFSAFGYLSQMINVPIHEIAVDGPGLVFVIYPETFVTMPVSPLWAILFFTMLLFLGLDSQFAMVEVMATSLMDTHNKYLLKYLKRKEFVVLVVCAVAFLLGIPNVTQLSIGTPVTSCLHHMPQTSCCFRVGFTFSSSWIITPPKYPSFSSPFVRCSQFVGFMVSLGCHRTSQRCWENHQTFTSVCVGLCCLPYWYLSLLCALSSTLRLYVTAPTATQSGPRASVGSSPSLRWFGSRLGLSTHCSHPKAPSARG
ncbi:sodium- and chloride-dependent GABA transporter ine isoform X2 [Mobula hypostoma]|uniref:sodium- and chloride-dependent GABA transporter ine isoform X2 n=1 Tax=Mobula hypostoma TaxID=723540 RepID=UPI002FC2A144